MRIMNKYVYKLFWSLLHDKYTVVILHTSRILLLFNTNSAIFQLYHGENKLIFNEMMVMRFALYWTNMLSWIFIVLDH